MQPKQLLAFLGASLMLHVLLLLFVFSGLLSVFFTVPEHDEAKSPLTLTLIPELPTPPPTEPALTDPNKKHFVDTRESRLVPKADPRTMFEGEQNTAASSVTPGTGNPFLPSQQGVNLPGINLHNQDYSPDLKGNPQPPSQDNPARESPPQEQAQQPKKAVEAREASKNPRENLAPRPDGTFGITEQMEPRKAQEEVKPVRPSPQQQNPTTQSTPAASFSAQKRANTIQGGAAPGDDSSIGAEESEMGRYKAKVFRAIGSRWYIYVNRDSGLIGLGSVRVKFFIRSDGVITEMQILEGKQLSGLLAVSRRSIGEVSGQLEPFPQSMKDQLGNGYWEEVSFTVY